MNIQTSLKWVVSVVTIIVAASVPLGSVMATPTSSFRHLPGPRLNLVAHWTNESGTVTTWQGQSSKDGAVLHSRYAHNGDIVEFRSGKNGFRLTLPNGGASIRALPGTGKLLVQVWGHVPSSCNRPVAGKINDAVVISMGKRELSREARKLMYALMCMVQPYRSGIVSSFLSQGYLPQQRLAQAYQLFRRSSLSPRRNPYSHSGFGDNRLPQANISAKCYLTTAGTVAAFALWLTEPYNPAAYFTFAYLYSSRSLAC